MKFHVMANKTYRFELTVEREYEVDVTKKAVVDAGLCANVEDGDPTAWYDYAEDYLREKGLEHDVQSPESITLDDDIYDLLGMN